MVDEKVNKTPLLQAEAGQDRARDGVCIASDSGQGTLPPPTQADHIREWILQRDRLLRQLTRPRGRNIATGAP